MRIEKLLFISGIVAFSLVAFQKIYLAVSFWSELTGLSKAVELFMALFYIMLVLVFYKQLRTLSGDPSPIQEEDLDKIFEEFEE